MTTPPLCSCDHRVVGDRQVVVTVTGEVDLSNVADVESMIRDALANAAAVVAVIDIAGVAYLDSAAFAAIERIARSVPVRLVVPSTALVFRAVEFSGLHDVVQVFESVDAALA
jgi:anti-anti-sigma factor